MNENQLKENQLIGTNLTRLRAQWGLSQDQLATVIEVTQPTLSRYESGVMTIPAVLLCRLSKRFGISLDEFIQSPDCMSSLEMMNVMDINDPRNYLDRNLGTEDQTDVSGNVLLFSRHIIMRGIPDSLAIAYFDSLFSDSVCAKTPRTAALKEAHHTLLYPRHREQFCAESKKHGPPVIDILRRRDWNKPLLREQEYAKWSPQHVQQLFNSLFYHSVQGRLLFAIINDDKACHPVCKGILDSLESYETFAAVGKV